MDYEITNKINGYRADRWLIKTGMDGRRVLVARDAFGTALEFKSVDAAQAYIDSKLTPIKPADDDRPKRKARE